MTALKLPRSALRVLAFGLVAALALAAAAASPAPAFGHVPVLEQPNRDDTPGTKEAPFPRAQPVPPPVRSLALYGYLARDERLDAYTFTVPEKVTTTVELLVPARTGLDGFRPALAVVSESSGAPQDVTPLSERSQFWEPFSVASFWRLGEAEVTFVEGERYYFVVRQGNGPVKAGPYVIAVGGAEEFSTGDWASSAAAMPRIWLGSWGGGPPRPGAIACLVFVLIGVPLAIVLVRRRRRRRLGRG